MGTRISQLPPKGANLANTDLLMISKTITGGYESKSITGAEIIASAQTGMQTELISGTNIKTVNSTSLLGSGDIAVQPTLVSGTNIKTVNGNSLLGSGDLVISTSLTIGTTAITSGTVGRLLFEGTGNVVQESANLFWDNTNSRLGIGQSTPTARIHIQGSSALSANSSLVVFNNTPTEIFRIRDNGNVQIGTTTEAGFKLDVNGTARVQGNLEVTGSNTLTVRNLNINSVGQQARIEYTYSGGTLLQFGRMLGTTGTNRQFDIIHKTPDYGTTGQQILTLFPSASIKYNNAAASTAVATETASACFEIASTTKGFLPPRMTNAQMVAIATPAAGLMVYDTTNNKMCVYDGTAWQNLY